MPRTRQGSVLTLKDGTIYARVRYLDENGQRKERRKLAKNLTDANKKRNEMIRELDDYGSMALDTSMTFTAWLDHYEATYVIEPQYRDDSKVAGLRSWKRCRSVIKVAPGSLRNE